MRGGREGQRVWGCCCCFVGTWWNWGLLKNESSRCCKERPDRCTVTFLNLETPKGEDLAAEKRRRRFKITILHTYPLLACEVLVLVVTLTRLFGCRWCFRGFFCCSWSGTEVWSAKAFNASQNLGCFDSVDPLRQTDRQRHTHTETLLEENISSRATQKPLSFHNFNGLGFLFFPGQLGSP